MYENEEGNYWAKNIYVEIDGAFLLASFDTTTTIISNNSLYFYFY